MKQIKKTMIIALLLLNFLPFFKFKDYYFHTTVSTMNDDNPSGLFNPYHPNQK